MDQKVIDFLNGQREAHSAYRATHYAVYFGLREVTVEVQDRGPEAATDRFRVYAEWARPDEESALRGDHHLGDAAATLEEALASVNWWIFEPQS
ncbi:hypothetical protein [Microbacterium oleivorans]|uniref:Uncharacterized protein n=1 Tax=Microbacterium oleivorans TaxID=273677 RepID=A0A4R5YI22_9MICO|nr:hypothetical protein [Microbacterium oleivorans]TDL44058.1 hypothetical protein E2R54_12900 [Microbacterium oleivorans]